MSRILRLVPGDNRLREPPADLDIKTLPLSHSFDRSTNVSDAGCEYPSTPLSLAESARQGTHFI